MWLKETFWSFPSCPKIFILKSNSSATIIAVTLLGQHVCALFWAFSGYFLMSQLLAFWLKNISNRPYWRNKVRNVKIIWLLITFEYFLLCASVKVVKIVRSPGSKFQIKYMAMYWKKNIYTENMFCNRNKYQTRFWGFKHADLLLNFWPYLGTVK